MGCGGSSSAIPVLDAKQGVTYYSITHEQITEHNKKHRNNSVWSPMKGNVYDVRSMYVSLSTPIQEAWQKRYPNCRTNVSRMGSSPSKILYLLATCKALNVDKYLLEEAKEGSYIGTVKIMSEEERLEDTSSHMKYAIQGLNDALNNTRASKREYLQASIDVISQSSAKCQSRKEVLYYFDLTEESFSVPKGCNKETLRSFLYEDYPLSWTLKNASKPDRSKDKYPLDSLTYRDIGEHNAENRRTAVWMPLGDNVYDVKGIYTSLVDIINILCRKVGHRYTYRYSIDHMVKGVYPHRSSFLLVLAECKILKMGVTTLERAKQLHLIGKLKTDETIREQEDDFRIHIEQAIVGLQDRLEHYQNSDDYVGSYLSATLQVYRNVADRYPLLKRKAVPIGYLNDANFYVPEWFDVHNLRSFIPEDYIPFDTTLDLEEEQDWTHLWKPDVGDAHAAFAICIRPWTKTEEPFDTNIEGEAGWSVIDDIDAIRNDIPTDIQLKLIESRSQRTDWNNRGRHQRRMRKLANYFALKYELNKEHVLERVNLWKESLEENARDLSIILSNPSVIIERKSDISPGSPAPIPRVFTVAAKNKMKLRRAAIAAYYDSRSSFKAHHRLHLENISYLEHVQRWNVNLEENAKALSKLCNG